MAAKEVTLSQAALKLLAEYSEAEGVSPSEVVLRFVPKPHKMRATTAKARSRAAQVDKLADTATDRTRARKALGKLSDKISTRANLSEKEVMARLKK
jgi:hypothetical protein